MAHRPRRRPVDSGRARSPAAICPTTRRDCCATVTRSRSMRRGWSTPSARWTSGRAPRGSIRSPSGSARPAPPPPPPLPPVPSPPPPPPPAARRAFRVPPRAMIRFRMLRGTLERIGVRPPAIYALAARQAARLGGLEGRRGFEAQAQFQGALAILARAAAVTTFDAARVQALVEQLVALPLTDDGR